jgi:integrase
MSSAQRNKKLTKRVVESATANGRRYVVWDSAIPGFGLTVSSTGKKSFILRYRPRRFGRCAPKRFITIGRFGPVTPDQARNRATEILGEVAKGKDPAAEYRAENETVTIADAAQQFLSSHVEGKCKPKTVELYRYAVKRKIVPALGKRKLLQVSRIDVAHFHHTMRAAPFMANRVIGALGSFYSWAGRRGLIPDDFNPTRRIDKFRENRRERFLSHDEFARLGTALREAETVGISYDIDESRPTAKHAAKPENRRVVVAPDAVAAIRLLSLTGCRLREVLNVRWEEVDFQRGLLLLPDSKTGRKAVVLGGAAVEVLRALPRVSNYVFPGADSAKPRTDLKRPWKLITRRAGLVGLRIHDLRHSYASVGVGAGLGLPIVGKLLGHTQPSTTARYGHLADDPVRQASEVISGQIAAAMGDETLAAVASTKG